LGDDDDITLDEFMEHGLRTATSYATTVAGTAAQIADDLEERFEGSGSRGGFMLRHSQAEQIEMLHNIVDLLVPELQRRGRFRTAYSGRTLRENLAIRCCGCRRFGLRRALFPPGGDFGLFVSVRRSSVSRKRKPSSASEAAAVFRCRRGTGSCFSMWLESLQLTGRGEG
jgi:hypothetical protein